MQMSDNKAESKLEIGSVRCKLSERFHKAALKSEGKFSWVFLANDRKQGGKAVGVKMLKPDGSKFGFASSLSEPRGPHPVSQGRASHCRAL